MHRIRDALSELFERTQRPELAEEIRQHRPSPPEAPRPMSPIDLAEVGPQATLRLASFYPPHRWVSHDAARWEIAEADTQADFQPSVFDVVCTDQLRELSKRWNA